MATVTFTDVSLRGVQVGDAVMDLKSQYDKAVPEICIERPLYLTEYYRKENLFGKKSVSILDLARAYRHVLEKRTPVVKHRVGYEKTTRHFPIETTVLTEFTVNDSSPFAGSTTSKFKGVPLYPEFFAQMLWPELSTVSSRPANPFQIAEADVVRLNRDIFPNWMKHTALELARDRYYRQNQDRLDLNDLKLMQNIVFFIASKAALISHTIPDFSGPINLGMNQMIRNAQDKIAETNDRSKIDFYSAVIEVLQGIIAYSVRLADEARRLARHESESEERDRLLEIERTYCWVPANPARTFREGLTTLWICWTALHVENTNVALSLGRLDQILYDLYRSDVEERGLTPQEATELVCYLWLKIGDHVPAMPETGEELLGGTGSNQAVTIGGVDKQGRDAVNDLTYVILRATELMRLRDPNLNARYDHEKNSRDYIERLCEVNMTTQATPAIHNDKAIISGLMAKGDSEEWARDYGIVGCVEPVSAGRHFCHTASIFLNLAAALELTIYNGKHRHTGVGPSDPLVTFSNGEPEGFTSFEEFWDSFRKQTHALIERAVRLNNNLGKIHQDYFSTPILSTLFEGPMENGKDVLEGGAAINSSGATIIAFADTVDSLYAIRKWVFEEQRISFAQLRDALDSNFGGVDYCDSSFAATNQLAALCELLNNPAQTPKYGNRSGLDNRAFVPDNDPSPDRNLARRTVNLLDKAFGEKRNYRGGFYRVGYWTMTMHAGFGRLTRALPNGRRDGQSFSSGITPVSRVTPDLGDVLAAATALPAAALSSGVALNMKFVPPPDPGDQAFREKLADVVDTYFGKGTGADGGVEIQFNITKRDDFIEFRDHPERCDEPPLVRVSGYTAYFTDLNRKMQDEIICRTDYELATGNMVYSRCDEVCRDA